MESAQDFAERVKRAIAEHGGLLSLPWDANIKRKKTQHLWKQQHQEKFARTLKID
jgi:glycerol-3-phosphate O-acyltransferase 3/4